ncbi:MAG: hypothetical protein WKG07_03940 [Hymenobacter sp.]
MVLAWLLGLVVLSGRLAGACSTRGRLRRAGTQALGREAWQQRLARAGRPRRAAPPGGAARVGAGSGAAGAGPLAAGYSAAAGRGGGPRPQPARSPAGPRAGPRGAPRLPAKPGPAAVAEVLFFYHPAVWFMAGRLRAERENCCDDQAAALCGGDRRRWPAPWPPSPSLLPQLSWLRRAWRWRPPGGRGQLLARVRRLVLEPPPGPLACASACWPARSHCWACWAWARG